jgi:hypothetical protein
MSIFSWFTPRREQEQKTKQTRHTPKTKDWTDDLQANTALTRALYRNEYPGMKLAGALAYSPISVPVWFMGLPIVEAESETDQELVDQIANAFSRLQAVLHTYCHLDGTLWVYPKFSMKTRRIHWELIDDDAVSDIIRDIETGEIIELITHENITIKTGYGQHVNAIRKRSFTREQVTVTWQQGEQQLPVELKEVSMRNRFGVMPVCFANNPEPNMKRGVSDYSRIISDLKNYHDLELANAEMLAKFKVKWIQETQDVDAWLSANAYDDINDIDIASADIIFNLKDQESTDFKFPERAYEAYKESLKRSFRKIVQGSNVPEIAWGLKTEGNRASVEENMSILHQYVQDKQEQKNEAYLELYDYSLRLLKATMLDNSENKLSISWNNLDAVSEEVRSVIFRNFAQGMAALKQNTAITKEQMYNMFKQMYPNITEETFELFKQGLSDMAAFKQFETMTYEEGRDYRLENDES